jgi:rare lipoprotein A
VEEFLAEFRKAMKFFGITTYSPGGLFQVCFGGVHVRLAADARPKPAGGFLSLVRRLAPPMAAAVAALFCLHFAAPAAAEWRDADPRRIGRAARSGAEAHETGHASWYGTPGDGFAYRTTACGETMDPDAWTCAHKSLPFGTIVLVENLLNGRTAVLRVNDRGPYVRGRVVDLSRRAAAEIGILGRGVVPVRVRLVDGILKRHVTQAVRPAAPFPAAARAAREYGPAPRRRLAETRPRGGADLRAAPPATEGGGGAGGAGRRPGSRRLDPYINREA